MKYTGPARDYSGYGEANRHDIAALLAAGIEVTTEIPHYCMEISDYGRLGDIAGEREKKSLDYKIKIIHTTPNVYQQFFEPGKYHIGRVFWETDKLPQDFAYKVQMCDEIWTGSEFNKQAIINAGVTKPIFVIPEAIDIFKTECKPYVTNADGSYRFYSIFEWTERKNPKALLRAFWHAFEDLPQGVVSLNIKTYVDNFTKEKAQEFMAEASYLRKSMSLKNEQPVYFFTRLMDRHQVYRFHESFDCFVSAHRGEGWGIPQMEALLMHKPVISTACGGIHEYMHDGIDSKLIPFKMIPLRGNSRNQQWYTPDQNWADVDETVLAESMRWVYDNQQEAKLMGEKGGQLVDKLFSFDTVGNLMLQRLQQIKV